MKDGMHSYKAIEVKQLQSKYFLLVSFTVQGFRLASENKALM